MATGFGKHWDMVIADHEKVCAESAARRRRINELEALLHELTDCETDPCSLDHTGFCQVHDSPTENGGCVIVRAREALADVRLRRR
jgi:hypothetical protein